MSIVNQKITHSFIVNDCGVVINPDIIWQFKPKNALAWFIWEIKVGRCENGLWDYGGAFGGGGSPVSNGTYPSKEAAIDAAIDMFKTKVFQKHNTNIYSRKKWMEGKKSFISFVNSRLYERGEWFKNDNKKSGMQLELF